MQVPKNRIGELLQNCVFALTEKKITRNTIFFVFAFKTEKKMQKVQLLLYLRL